MPSWQIVCHVNSIPRAGDYETFDLGPESVLVLRDRDGSIRAFHNVCRHRGARLLDGAGNCPATITCPYHGWSYRHDGSLIGVPVRDSFPGLERAEHGLRAGARRHRLRLRLRLPRRRPAAGRARSGASSPKNWRPIASRRWYRSRRFPPKSGTSIGKSRWITTWSRITCRSAIRVCTACSRRTMTTRPRCRASRAA